MPQASIEVLKPSSCSDPPAGFPSGQQSHLQCMSTATRGHCSTCRVKSVPQPASSGLRCRQPQLYIYRAPRAPLVRRPALPCLLYQLQHSKELPRWDARFSAGLLSIKMCPEAKLLKTPFKLLFQLITYCSTNRAVLSER